MPELKPAGQAMTDQLLALGIAEREAVRAGLYVDAFGTQALTGDQHAVFQQPTCGNWNCLKPDHQVLEH